MAAKKKPVSAAQVRKAEEVGKAKQKIQARTDSQGRSGMGASKSNSVKPGFYTTGQRTSSKLTDAQNLARSIAVGGPIIKAVAGKVAGAGAKKVVQQTAKTSVDKGASAATKARADRYYDQLLEKALKASPNGKVSGSELQSITRRAEAMAKQVTKKK